MGLISRTRDALTGETRYTVDDYAAWVHASFVYGGNTYALGNPVQQTLAGNTAEKIGADFIGLTVQAYQANGVVFACMLNRQLVFSTVRFQYQRISGGRQSEMFGDQSLEVLEKPWPGGTTQDLLTRVINDADLAGNSYTTAETSLATLGGDGGRYLVRLRPDWTGIVLGRRRSGLGHEKVGYVFRDGGLTGEGGEVYLLPDEVAHYAPIVDPLATYRGMSWLTPVIREVQADQLMNTHKRRFFENGATPNMVIKHPASMTAERVREFRDKLDASHRGAGNAYKTMHIGAGADVTVVGADFKQLEFAVSQGHGETRVAAAAGIPPVIVGLSEGLAAATYSNYGQARRRYADGTMHPLWQNVAGSFAPLMKDARPLAQPGVRLWYDHRDVPFLREDEKDAADIAETKARTIRTLVDGGYTPDSARRAVMSGDFGLLEHSGLYSVQLQAAGTPSTPQPAQEAP